MEAHLECSGDLLRNSCLRSPALIAERDVLAAARVIVSLLRQNNFGGLVLGKGRVIGGKLMSMWEDAHQFLILGASAIITNIIKRKHVWKPLMHPIFQLSIADWLLGLLWIIGSYLWFRGASSRVWCFSVSLLTVILECVTANLTLVYAILAYSSLKKKRQNTSAMEVIHLSSQIWHPTKSVLIYITAWIVPTVVVMTAFGVLSASTHLVTDANKCSCWCFPHLGNIVPYSHESDVPSALYIRQIRKLLVSYGVILFLNFLGVFLIITWLYQKALREIRNIKKNVAAMDDDLMNHALSQGQALARKRITLYLTVFLTIALSIVILSVVVIYNEGESLLQLVVTLNRVKPPKPQHHLFIIVHLCHSVTVPLQGFLNSIIYGLTVEDIGDSIMGNFTITLDSKKNFSKLHDTSDELDTDDDETTSIIHSQSVTYH